MGPTKKVLFICTRNAGRSQIAQALLDELYPDEYIAYSAGTEPGQIHKGTIATLEKIGIETSNLISKHLDQFMDMELDYVITLCDDANENCPNFPGGKEHIHKSFPDPDKASGTPQEAEVFDNIRELIKAWLMEFFNL